MLLIYCFIYVFIHFLQRECDGLFVWIKVLWVSGPLKNKLNSSHLLYIIIKTFMWKWKHALSDR